MKKLILFLLIQLAASNNLNRSDYCYDQGVCTGEYHYSCIESLCSKDMYKCQAFKFLTLVVGYIKNEKANRALDMFASLISECPVWDPKYVCLNDAICYHDVMIPFRLAITSKMIIRKRIKCKCTGNLVYTCGKGQEYCATDKRACDRLNTTSVGINRCKNWKTLSLLFKSILLYRSLFWIKFISVFIVMF